MSKGEGKKIGIEFTEALAGDITEKNIDGFILPKGTFTASNTANGYPVTNAFDGNANTFWYNNWGGNAQWIQIRLPSPTLIIGFKWRNVAGYRPKNFKLQGSINGTTWVDIYTSTSLNADDFQEFTFEAVTYEYYRWTFLNYYSSYVRLSELELKVKVGNEAVFTIIGQEYKYVNGPLVNGDYKVEKIEPHPTRENSILLTMKSLMDFNKVEGLLTINYDATKGNLSGQGGAIDSFETSFSPVDLVQVPNPGIIETITGAPTISINYLEVTYHKGYEEETITAAPAEITVDLVYVGVINP